MGDVRNAQIYPQKFILTSIYAEPLLLLKEEKSLLQNERTENIILSPVYAEPLFTGINYGNPASEDYMMIEPLFISKGDTPRYFESVLQQNNTQTCFGGVSAVIVNEETVKCSVNSVKEFYVITNDSDDVTILPEALTSSLHCLRLVSARRARLRGLCNTAIWRAIKMLAAWICVILFVFWLSSIFSLSTFPENPFKFFLNEKERKKKKKSKTNKSGKNNNEEEKDTVLPSICYEDLYEFSKWDKFTEGRPKTEVFYHGTTFTYEKLPPFPKSKAKKPKTKRKPRKNIVAESGSCDNLSAPESALCDTILPISVDISVSNSILHTSILNPLAIPFNYNLLKDDDDCSTTLRTLRVSNIGNIIIAHLNINSLRYKFDSLVELIQGNLDILIIGETKLDKSFPDEQFKINGLKLYRKDRNEMGRGHDLCQS